MASRAATYWNSKARPLMWTEHGETVTLHDPSQPASQQDSTLSVIFRRQRATGRSQAGIGAESFEGTAEAVVRLTDMPTKPGARSSIVREGEKWQVRWIERQDEWTWVMHLEHPNRVLAIRPGVSI